MLLICLHVDMQVDWTFGLGEQAIDIVVTTFPHTQPSIYILGTVHYTYLHTLSIHCSWSPAWYQPLPSKSSPCFFPFSVAGSRLSSVSNCNQCQSVALWQPCYLPTLSKGSYKIILLQFAEWLGAKNERCITIFSVSIQFSFTRLILSAKLRDDRLKTRFISINTWCSWNLTVYPLGNEGLIYCTTLNFTARNIQISS